MRNDIEKLSHDLLEILAAKNLTLVTAESCTAGLLAQQIADTPRAGACFHGAFVTYTKEHKNRVLDVPSCLLRDKGAVCSEVARAMAEGALQHSTANLAAAITGVAGPEPDEDGNPVGRVCIAVARRDGASETFERHYLNQNRDDIRSNAIADTLAALIFAASSSKEKERDL
jgi:nicotinamide-nucleotide amidase